MKLIRIHACSAPKCSNPADFYVELENGARPLKVCGRHTEWGKKQGREIEAS